MLSPKSKSITPVNRQPSHRGSLDSSSATAPIPIFRNVSTISNDIRIGRSGSIPNNNYISTSSHSVLSDARNNRSPHDAPSASNRRYSFPESCPSPGSANENLNLRKMSNEQIIDLMEKEQDAIVLKLMKEIETLKDENKNLKASLSSALQSSSINGGIRRTSSISQADVKNMNFGSSSSISPNTSNTSLNSTSNKNSNFLLDRDESKERKKVKRKSSNEIPRKSSTEYSLIEKNQLLQDEVRILRGIINKR